MSKLPAPVIFVIGLAVFVLVLVGINQYILIQERRKKKLTKLSNKELENVILEWIDDPIFKFQRKITDDCLFQFEITDMQARRVSISRVKSAPTHIELASAMLLGEKDRAIYKTLNDIDKNNTIHELRIEMARLGVSFGGIDINLEKIEFSDVILLDDSLNELYLRQRLFLIIRAIVLFLEVFSQQVEKYKQSK